MPDLPPSPPNPPAPKLPLPIYAAIKAALTEGFPLDKVLATEGVPLPRWQVADRKWKARLATDSADLARYEVELASAEDWLHRDVSPLSSDLRGWLSFLDAYRIAPEPFEWLKGLGLGLNDISRLKRSWDRRMKEDRSIEKRIATIRREGLARLPRLVIQPAVLRRSRASQAMEAQASKAPIAPPGLSLMKTAATADLGLSRYAAIVAHVELDVPDLEHALRRLGVGSKEALTTLHAQWKRRFQRDPTLARDFRLLVGHEKQRIESKKAGGALDGIDKHAPAAPISGAWVAPKSLNSTSLAVEGPRAPVLPFIKQAVPGIPNSMEGWRASPLPKPVPMGTALSIGPAPPEVKPFRPALETTPAQANGTHPGQLPHMAPKLTLEQHASLTVELALAPQLAASILERYHLSPEDKKALDATYEARMANAPDVRAAWEQAYKAYQAWVSQARR